MTNCPVVPFAHLKGTVSVLLTVTVVAAWPPLTNLKLYPPEIQSPGRIRRWPSMLDGPMSNVLPDGGPQDRVDGKSTANPVSVVGGLPNVRVALPPEKETVAFVQAPGSAIPATVSLKSPLPSVLVVILPVTV